MNKNNLIKQYLIFGIFFLIILFLSPISGDDWGNYLVGIKGIRHIIGQAIGMYFSWEGRIVSRLLINVLTYNKILWNFANSFIIILIINLINIIIKPKNKKMIFLLSMSIFLFMNIYSFSQTITWVAGNITYLFVIPIILYYIYLTFNKNKFSKKEIIICLIINIIGTMFVENASVVIILYNIINLIINYIKNKKIDKNLLIFLIISIFSFLLMFLSPGNKIRNISENVEFNNLNIIEKIIYNIPNFIYYTFVINYWLIIIMIISNIILVNKNIKNKYIKVLLILFFISIIVYPISYLLYSLKICNNIIDYSCILSIIYFSLYTIFSIILLIKNSNNYLIDKCLLFYVLGISSNLVMLLSPTWGYRTSICTYIFLFIVYLIIIDKYTKENKVINNILLFINVLSMTFYLIFYININILYKENLNNINNSIKNNSSYVEIYTYPSFAPCNINPADEYHLKVFKEYYNIPEIKEVRLIDNKWKWLIIYKKY